MRRWLDGDGDGTCVRRVGWWGFGGRLTGAGMPVCQVMSSVLFVVVGVLPPCYSAGLFCGLDDVANSTYNSSLDAGERGQDDDVATSGGRWPDARSRLLPFSQWRRRL